MKRGVALGPVVPGVELEQGHLLLERGTLREDYDKATRLAVKPCSYLEPYVIISGNRN